MTTRFLTPSSCAAEQVRDEPEDVAVARRHVHERGHAELVLDAQAEREVAHPRARARPVRDVDDVDAAVAEQLGAAERLLEREPGRRVDLDRHDELPTELGCRARPCPPWARRVIPGATGGTLERLRVAHPSAARRAAPTPPTMRAAAAMRRHVLGRRPAATADTVHAGLEQAARVDAGSTRASPCTRSAPRRAAADRRSAARRPARPHRACRVDHLVHARRPVGAVDADRVRAPVDEHARHLLGARAVAPSCRRRRTRQLATIGHRVATSRRARPRARGGAPRAGGTSRA